MALVPDLYRLVFAGSPDAMIIFDLAEGLILDANDAALELYGCAREEMIGKPMRGFSAEAEATEGVFARLAKGETVRTLVRVLKRRDGTTFSIDGHATPLLVGGRKVALSVNRDVSEALRVQSELAKATEQLRESEAFLEKAQEVGNSGSWVYNIGEDTVFWSRQCRRIFGTDDAPRRGLSDFYLNMHPDDRESNRKIRAKALAEGSTYSDEFRVVRADGEVRWIHSHADVIRDESGRAVKMVGVVTDITERKLNAEKLRAAEQQLRESQKMEAVGRLAGGIAHDFNNILTAILGLTDLSLNALPAGDPVRKDLEEIRLSGRRAAELTRQLLAFSRRQAMVPKVLGLDAAVLGVLKMLQSIIGENVKIAVRPAAGGACVRVDPGQLDQLIVNLAVNARDAMPGGGTLTIETSATTLTAEAAAGHDGLAAGDYAVLSVSDSGTGMDDAVRSRIFEPFFTTKEPGKGTGLGLATCYGIVKQSGGAILCASRPGQGTRFHILLPRCEPEPAVSEAAEAPTEVKGTERVLVVEDEDIVRRLVVRMLRERGFDTVEARDGQEGLEVLGLDSERRIRLIVTDVVMPRLGGLKMAALAAGLRPDVPVLFTSGYNEEMSGPDAVAADVDFLRKPFSAEQLTGRVRLALDAAKP